MKKRYRVKITAAGYVYVLITIILGVGAVNTGNNLLYLMSSLLLALMVLSGMSSLGNLFSLSVSRSASSEACYGGYPGYSGERTNCEKSRKLNRFLPKGDQTVISEK